MKSKISKTDHRSSYQELVLAHRSEVGVRPRLHTRDSVHAPQALPEPICFFPGH